INSSANVGGVQFALNYDPAVLTPTAVNIGTFFSDYATANSCSTFSVSFLPPPQPGQTKVGAFSLVGCPGPGPTGQDQVATVTFTAASGVNKLTSIALSSALVSDFGGTPTTLGVSSGTVQVGTPAADATNLDFNPSASQVPGGGTLAVDVDLSTLAAGTDGVSFALTYDSPLLPPPDVAVGAFFASFAANNACTASITAPFLPPASPGLTQTGTIALSGCPSPGPTGFDQQ